MNVPLDEPVIFFFSQQEGFRHGQWLRDAPLSMVVEAQKQALNPILIFKIQKYIFKIGHSAVFEPTPICKGIGSSLLFLTFGLTWTDKPVFVEKIPIA